MTKVTKCDWASPTNGCETREVQECKRCGKTLCSYHFDATAHIVYGCKCKICGEDNFNDTTCGHGLPTWTKGNSG